MTIDTIPGLNDVDSTVLRLCCEAQLEEESLRDILRPETIFGQTDEMDLHRDDVRETLEVLDGSNYVKLTKSAEGNLLALRVTDHGFGESARMYMPEYESAFRLVGLDLVNHERHDSRHVVEATGLPAVLVEHVLNWFDGRGYIGMQTLGSGMLYIHTVSPKLRHWLQET